MKIYDYGVFISHLDIEVQKMKRYGYSFSVLSIESDRDHDGLLRTLFATGFRMTDVIATTGAGRYVVLLNATRETGAKKLIERIESHLPPHLPFRYELTECREDDAVHDVLFRLHLTPAHTQNHLTR